MIKDIFKFYSESANKCFYLDSTTGINRGDMEILQKEVNCYQFVAPLFGIFLQSFGEPIIRNDTADLMSSTQSKFIWINNNKMP